MFIFGHKLSLLNSKHFFPVIIPLCIFVFSSCSTTKYIQENQYLLKENSIIIDGKKNKETEVSNFLIQRPNHKILGFPSGLHLYNVGKSKDVNHFQNKVNKIERKKSIWNTIFSRKQRYNNVRGRYNFRKWLLKSGEAPVVLKNQKTAKTAKNFKSYFFNQGYFKTKVNTNVTYDIKKASVTYDINKGKPTFIDSILFKIESPNISHELNKYNGKYLRKGEQYNVEDINKAANTITRKLRNNGFYHFDKSLISFRNIDSLSNNYKTNIEIHIKNPRKKMRDQVLKTPLTQKRIAKIGVFTDYSYQNRNKKPQKMGSLDSIFFLSYDKLKFRKKTLANSIFIESGDLYSDEKLLLTRDHLKSLKNFKLIKIQHKELENDQLATTILLTPLKKFNLGINTEIIHSNIKELGLSGGISFTDRNLFKGAEILKLSLQGSIFDAATRISNNDDKSFNAWELGVDASLELPKFLFPLGSKLIPRKMTPKTQFLVGASLQNNIGLDRETYTGSLNYKWNSSRKNKHVFELLNVQFVKNINSDSYFSIYSSEFNKIAVLQPLIDPNFNLNTQTALSFLQSIPESFRVSNPLDYNTLQNILNRRNIITTNNFIPNTSYSFEHNSRRGLSDTKYNFFKIKFTSAGNVSTSIFNRDKINDVEISQFLKLDIDWRKFWNIGGTHNTLAFRAFVGVASPINNKEVPFTFSYFAGGSNDIRAWKTYELGPGSSNTGLEFNIGNVKLLSSLEYRFKIINSIYGAAFVDAGNIWNLANNSVATSEETFDDLNDLSNIAIGTGFGLRYDFNFLVFRLDLGIKTYEPYLTDQKWFQNYSLKESVLNIGINYPF